MNFKSDFDHVADDRFRRISFHRFVKICWFHWR